MNTKVIKNLVVLFFVISSNILFSAETEGWLTKYAVGNGLRSALGTSFSYSDSLYPMVSNLRTLQASHVGASPIFLYVDPNDETIYDVHNNISHNFIASRRNGVSWRALKGNSIVEIGPQIGLISPVTIRSIGKDTLIAYIGTIEKYVPIEVTSMPGPDSVTLVLKCDPENLGTVTGAGKYLQGTKVEIEAILNDDCYRFDSWKDSATGNIVSRNAKDSITLNSNLVLIANFVRDTFNLTIDMLPAEATQTCSVTGAGKYSCGDEAIIEAISLSCYKFLHWLDRSADTVISTQSKDTLIIKENMDLRAVFEADTLTVTLRTEPPNVGRLSGGGDVICGMQAPIKAEEIDACYIFENWTTEDGTLFSDVASFMLPVKEDITLIANYKQVDDFEIILSENPANGGTTSGGGTFPCPGGETIIKATPNPGYVFVDWTYKATGSRFSDQPSVLIVVNKNYELVANFVEKPADKFSLELLSEPLNAGILTGGGIYDHNSTVPINAESEDCYTFEYWADLAGNRISTDANYSVTLISDTTLVAHFDVKKYTVTLNPNPIGGGTVAGDGTFDCGEEITIEATANPGYVFVDWTYNGTVLSTSSSLQITVTQDTTLTANFERDGNELFTVTLISAPLNAGILTGDGGYLANATANITATAQAGYTFRDWTDTLGTFVSANPNFDLTVTKDTILRANFDKNAPNKFTVNLSVNPQNAGTVSGSGDYDENEKVTITAQANKCYTFLNWTNAENEIVSSESSFDTTITENIDLTANFELDSFDLVLRANPQNAGTVALSGKYACGETVEIIATANSGYVFRSWTNENGTIISDEPTYSVIIENDSILIANFDEKIEPTNLTIKVNDHKLVSPNAKNFAIPIYISTNQDIQAFEIGKLVIEISRNIFHPTSLTKGDMNIQLSEITLTNIQVPALKAGDEVILTEIIGDVILGDKDSSAIIFLQEVITPEYFNFDFELISGLITLDICTDGSDRLLTNLGLEQGISIVRSNPTTEMLEIECKTIENGRYLLEIVDLLGNVKELKEWTVDNKIQTAFPFSIPVVNYGNGSYYIILHSPSNAKYSHKFIVEK